MIWPPAGFGLEPFLARRGERLHFLRGFVVFSGNGQKRSRPIFKNLGRSFLSNPSPQKRHSDCKFIKFYFF